MQGFQKVVCYTLPSISVTKGIIASMRLLPTSLLAHKNTDESNQRSLLSTYFAMLCLLALSVLVTACSSSANASTANPGNPPVTVTINIGNGGSPTPSLPGYTCGAWATNATAPYGTPEIGVYAKFVQLVNGNPVGVAGANAVATVIWPDGSISTITGTTGSDGLVTFAVATAGRTDALMKLVYITVAFTANGVPPCNVGQDRAAFFMLTIGGTGTPTVGSNGSPGTQPTGPTAKPDPGKHG